ncbi:MAG TPA: helix-turn-helix domain-containing protein [Ktedonobacterales bacterium]|nr:helix-turn-helix domain-containing protein [Ktedonobacterales bacterium]
MKTYTLDEAAHLLGISKNTLVPWMRKAGIHAARAKHDQRYHYLTQEQLDALAAAHGRVVTDQPDPLAAMQARIAALEAALGARPSSEEREPASRADMARWLEKHGVAFNTARQWPLPTDRQAALIYAQGHINAVGHRKGHNRLHQCEDTSCVCRSLLLF